MEGANWPCGSAWMGPVGSRNQLYYRFSKCGPRSVSSIIYAVRWQHTYFTFWHTLIIWYWINNYPIEYKPDITSLVSHWKQWICPQAVGRFSEDEVDGVGPSMVNALKKGSLHQRVFAVLGLILLWMCFSGKWPTKQKCCGSTVEKAIQTLGGGVFRGLYVLHLCIVFRPYVSMGITFWGVEQKIRKGKKIFFSSQSGRSWKVCVFFQTEGNFPRVIHLNWEFPTLSPQRSHFRSVKEKNI